MVLVYRHGHEFWLESLASIFSSCITIYEHMDRDFLWEWVAIVYIFICFPKLERIFKPFGIRRINIIAIYMGMKCNHVDDRLYSIKGKVSVIMEYILFLGNN